MNAIMKHPKAYAGLTTAVTLVVGAFAIILSDFGKPVWIFIPLLLWLSTMGLPTTLGVLLVASFWGTLPALTGFLRFVIWAALFALCCQTTAFAALAQLYRRRTGRTTCT